MRPLMNTLPDGITLVRGLSARHYAACADIWLEASLLAHDFASPALWQDQRDAMQRHYLPSSHLDVLERHGEAVAFSALCSPDGVDFLAALFVRPSCWRMGLGTVLVRHAMHGRHRLRLDVYRANSGARAFYARSGFVPTGESVCGHTGQPVVEMLWVAPLPHMPRPVANRR